MCSQKKGVVRTPSGDGSGRCGVICRSIFNGKVADAHVKLASIFQDNDRRPIRDPHHLEGKMAELVMA